MRIDGAIGIDLGYTVCACFAWLHAAYIDRKLKIHRNIDRLVDVLRLAGDDGCIQNVMH